MAHIEKQKTIWGRLTANKLLVGIAVGFCAAEAGNVLSVPVHAITEMLRNPSHIEMASKTSNQRWDEDNIHNLELIYSVTNCVRKDLGDDRITPVEIVWLHNGICRYFRDEVTNEGIYPGTDYYSTVCGSLEFCMDQSKPRQLREMESD